MIIMIKTKIFLYIKNLLLIIIVAVFSATLCKIFLFQFYIIPSDSMKTTLIPGDGILVSKIHYANQVFKVKIPGFSCIKKNDIIVFKQPEGEKETLIKRCVGLPGDTLLIKNYNVYITGDKIKTPEGSLVPEIQKLSYETGHVLPIFSESWNKADYGPVIIPQKGMTLTIDTSN